MEDLKLSPILKVSEVELIYKTKIKASERLSVKQTRDAYLIFQQYWNENKLELQEQFNLMLLNQANKVLGICNISTGGVTETVVDSKLIFLYALKANATRIIVAHNHPSGSLKPSSADISLTKKLNEGARLLDLSLLDHIIITAESYYSFADEGKL